MRVAQSTKISDLHGYIFTPRNPKYAQNQRLDPRERKKLRLEHDAAGPNRPMAEAKRGQEGKLDDPMRVGALSKTRENANFRPHLPCYALVTGRVSRRHSSLPTSNTVYFNGLRHIVDAAEERENREILSLFRSPAGRDEGGKRDARNRSEVGFAVRRGSAIVKIS